MFIRVIHFTIVIYILYVLYIGTTPLKFQKFDLHPFAVVAVNYRRFYAEDTFSSIYFFIISSEYFTSLDRDRIRDSLSIFVFSLRSRDDQNCHHDAGTPPSQS